MAAPTVPTDDDAVIVTFSLTVRGEEVELFWSEGSLTGDAGILTRLTHHGYDPDDLPDAPTAIAAVEHVVGHDLEIHVGDEYDDEAVPRPDEPGDDVIDLRQADGDQAADTAPSVPPPLRTTGNETFIESWFDSPGMLPAS